MAAEPAGDPAGTSAVRDPGLSGRPVHVARDGRQHAFLEATFGATAVEPQPNAVRRILAEPGAFDLLHFACHGVADLDNITGRAWSCRAAAKAGNTSRRTLVQPPPKPAVTCGHPTGRAPSSCSTPAAAGRAGYRLTGSGGFVQAFLKGQAGAFIGTLWSVGDAPAHTFTETFYARLVAGQTIAEATVAAREQARVAGDATWLAYVVYAHPHARLTR